MGSCKIKKILGPTGTLAFTAGSFESVVVLNKHVLPEKGLLRYVTLKEFSGVCKSIYECIRRWGVIS